MRIAKWCVLLLLVLWGAYACRKPYEEEVELRQMQGLRRMLQSKGDCVWVHDSVAYAPVKGAHGDSLVLEDGETLTVRYVLYGEQMGKLQMLASNIPSAIEEGGLGEVFKKEGDWEYEIGGEDGVVEGLRIAFEHFAHADGKAWIGIPSRLAYGRSAVGVVTPNTALVCYVEFVGYTGRRVEP